MEQSGKGISGRASSESSGVTPSDIRHSEKYSYDTKAKWPLICFSLSVLNTEAGTKWLPFCRQHFQMNFIN